MSHRRLGVRGGYWLQVWVLCLPLAVLGCGPTQVITDPECFKAVDSLWTAVTSRRPELVDQADKELDRLAAAGKMNATGRTELKSISDTAKKGDWEPAARSLKSFIQGQRVQKAPAS